MEMRGLDEDRTVSGARCVCVPSLASVVRREKGFHRSFYAQFERDAPQECKIKKYVSRGSTVLVKYLLDAF